MFIEGESQELTVIQAKVLITMGSLSFNDQTLENNPKRTVKVSLTDGSTDVLESLADNATIKGIWTKFDQGWLFSYAEKVSEHSFQGIMFRVTEEK